MEALAKLLAQLCDRGSQQQETVITRPGSVEAVPDAKVTLIAPGPAVVAALTGPDGGILGMQQKLKTAADFLNLPWKSHSKDTIAAISSSPGIAATETAQGYLIEGKLHEAQQQPQQQQRAQQQSNQAAAPQDAWGNAVSLYDRDPLTGLRNGDPIADQYGIITYANGGAVMALADGVNWGQRPLWAARAAVYGFLNHVHQELVLKHGGKSINSSSVFHIMQAAVQSAQQHVLAADGTLTTLVAAVVCQQRRGGKCSVLSVCIGDSPAFVWRSATAAVEDVTYTPPLHGFHRDPRVCPGCLGYAIGDAPDLSNMTYSITTVQQGDIVFLTSDGIADNFDPVTRKQASPRTIGEGSNRSLGVGALSPATCHAMAVAEMAAVLKDACRQQQEGSFEAPAADVLLGSSRGALPAVVSDNSKQEHPTQPLGLVDGASLTAVLAVNSLIAFAQQATAEQRRVLEDPSTRQSMTAEQLADLVASLPGKMDHASVVAYKVGGHAMRTGSSSSSRRSTSKPAWKQK